MKALSVPVALTEWPQCKFYPLDLAAVCKRAVYCSAQRIARAKQNGASFLLSVWHRECCRPTAREAPRLCGDRSDPAHRR
jgi:hypothetical protein